jgi:IS4 transposase
MLGAIFERFVEHSPVSVMARGLMERVFARSSMDDLFEATAEVQYTRELLFSSVVELMSLVVCAIHPSVHAAYRAKVKEMSVSLSALYAKLNGIELAVSRALVQQTASSMSEIVTQMGGQAKTWVAGHRVKILDGLWLAATEHRLKELRLEAAAALPGKSLVVLDPQLRLAIDVFPCEDGHAQERSLLGDVLSSVQANDLWMADRNMCTLGFLFGLQQHQATFVIRQHGGLPYHALDELRSVGTSNTGVVFEQYIELEFESQRMQVRRIVVKLNQPTQDEDTEIAILTTLAPTVARAVEVAQLYRTRWTIEGFFQSVTLNFEGEIQTLAYPKAALFSFCTALVAANILAVVRAALASVHGNGKIEAGLSDFYLVDEIQHTYRGMIIAIEPEQWTVFQSLPLSQLAQLLQHLAAKVHLASLLKTPRAYKKKKPPLTPKRNQPHLSTAKLLSQRSSSP